MQSLTRKNVQYLTTTRRSFISLPGFLFVLAAHGALFYGLWNQRLISTPEQTVTLFAEIISAPQPQAAPKTNPETNPEPPPAAKVQPIKKPEPKPQPQRLASKAPALPQQEAVTPPPEPESEPETEPNREPEPVVAAPPEQLQTGPVTLSSELSVSCPQLTAPAYPSISRRMGEEGKLLLRVELDESGRVDDARVVDSSGYDRLDNAALAAVKNWQCNPSTRNGQPVRAVALQPFNFVLQGN